MPGTPAAGWSAHRDQRLARLVAAATKPEPHDADALVAAAGGRGGSTASSRSRSSVISSVCSRLVVMFGSSRRASACAAIDSSYKPAVAAGVDEAGEQLRIVAVARWPRAGGARPPAAAGRCPLPGPRRTCAPPTGADRARGRAGTPPRPASRCPGRPRRTCRSRGGSDPDAPRPAQTADPARARADTDRAPAMSSSYERASSFARR